MKLFKSALMLALGALMITGCASAPAASGTNESKTDTAQTQKNDKTTPAKTETADVEQAGQALKKAFEDAGYTTVDSRSDPHEFEFEIQTSNSRVDADVQGYTAAGRAETKYKDEINIDDEDEETMVNAYHDGDKYLAVIQDTDDSRYTIEACDAKANLTYSLDDILSGDLDPVLKVLEDAGFPTR